MLPMVMPKPAEAISNPLAAVAIASAPSIALWITRRTTENGRRGTRERIQPAARRPQIEPPATIDTAVAATAQALYALAAGATTAVLMVVSGWLFGALGGQAFLGMALLCAAALPLTRGLRSVA